MKKILLLLLLCTPAAAQELWWGGALALGGRMPYTKHMNLLNLDGGGKIITIDATRGRMPYFEKL